MASSAKGTKENPYSMSECDEMLDNGTWPGGYVKDDSGQVSYVMKSVTVWGYSGSGSGSEEHGSDFEFSTGSHEWHESDDEENGSEEEGNRPPSGNEGDNQTDGNYGGGAGGGTGGSPGGTSLSVMTQSEFNIICKICAVTPAVSSLLKTLYDAKKIVTYPTGTYSSAARYNSSKKRLEISRQTLDNNNAQTVYHELVHYVQDQKGLLANTSCNSEFQAYLMVCYMQAYKGYGWGNILGFDEDNNDIDEIITPFYDYFDDVKEGKSGIWPLMAKTLNNADWDKYTNQFRTYWQGKTTNPAYTSDYDSASPWCWKEMFQTFGLIRE